MRISRLIDKKVGIWGFGIVGKSVYSYLHARGITLSIMDIRPLGDTDARMAQAHNTPFYLQSDADQFLEQHDYIIPSPGIDLRPFDKYQHKWLSELDLFANNYEKPIIAITGSVGKTSVTHLLGQLLNKAENQYAVGGNIGIGMFDIMHTTAIGAILEVSSFQLALCRAFRPTLSVWTNFYPNHLDRHTDAPDYFNAKYRIIAHQTAADHAIISMALQQQIYECEPACTITFFSAHTPTPEQLRVLRPQDYCIFSDGKQIIKYHQHRYQPLIDCAAIPAVSFQENWIIIIAVLDLLTLPLTLIRTHTVTLPEHRLEKIATINGCAIYNDSKSTTPQSTLAAVQQLQTKPIHLLLGGVSKGVDRSVLINQLKGHVQHIYCFGKEAEQLHMMCQQAHIASSAHATLDSAVTESMCSLQPGEQLLLSPAGASFDLFAHFMERGNYFKTLIKHYTQH